MGLSACRATLFPVVPGTRVLPDLTLDEPRMIALTGAIALLAGLVRGFSGFGGPAIMALVLTQFYSPLSVLTKVAIIDAVSYLLLAPTTAREFNRRVTVIVTLQPSPGSRSGHTCWWRWIRRW